MSPNNESTTLKLEPDFMEKIREELEKRQFKIVDIQISAGSGKGDNYLGIISKVCAHVKDERGTKKIINWIAKSAPQGEMLRKALDIDALFLREVFVYEDVFPQFSRFQDELCVLKPFDYYAGYAFNYIEKFSFVMEDMKCLGYEMRNRKEPLNYEHVKLVMEAYGKLHAISFGMRLREPEEFLRLAQATPDVMFNKELEDEESVKKYMNMYHNKVLGSLSVEEDALAIAGYRKYMEDDYNNLKKAVNTTNEYSVIGHGDSWVNNMLFKYENIKHPRRPTRVCLLDWQLCRYGSPALDLSYFLFTCTDKALRDEYYDSMIKLYYHSLCQHLVDLGGDPESQFPFQALRTELQRCSIYGLHMSVAVVQLMMSEVDEIPDFQNMKKDVDVAIMDYKSVNDDLYKGRIKGIVSDFSRYGYFDFDSC